MRIPCELPPSGRASARSSSGDRRMGDRGDCKEEEMRNVWCVPRAKLRDVMGRGRESARRPLVVPRSIDRALPIPPMRHHSWWAAGHARPHARPHGTRRPAPNSHSSQRSDLLRAPAAAGTCARVSRTWFRYGQQERRRVRPRTIARPVRPCRATV